jgi:aspartate/methionine/tyrosine aminotransferase
MRRHQVHRGRGHAPAAQGGGCLVRQGARLRSVRRRGHGQRGAKQVIHNAFHALLDAGDEVILPAPCWVSYAEIAKLAGAKPFRFCPAPKTVSWSNPDAIARAITPATRMIVLCSPSNPTGAIYDELTLRAIASLALKHDLWLLTDDIYRSLCYGDAALRAAGDLRSRDPQAHHHRGWRVQDLSP